MITVYNANNMAQQWFFKRAYAHLEAENLLLEASKNENKTFPNLESYFANIGNLINLRAEYALIPSDEEPFEIDANTRAIKIPNAFAKGVAVAGDDMSEVITFTIDRYFDYVDLAGTKICVQWEHMGKEGGKGISYISLIDLETVPGKIRFGWPLTDNLTKAGKVNFAVRFFVENTNMTEQDPSPFTYVLNTLPSTITILEGLNIVEPSFSEANIENEFLKFVRNSQNPALPKANSPFWNDKVGKDLKEQSPAAINPTTDTLTLEAQALVNGNGYIKYQWYFKDGVSGIVTPIAEGDERFTINNQVFREVEDTERKINEQYYVKVVDENDPEAEAYELYVNETLPTDGTKLYERFTTLKFNPTPEGGDDSFNDVTGTYWVAAENYVGADAILLDPAKPELGTIPSINYSTPANSSECIVPTPGVMELIAEPAETVFIEGGSVLLQITVNTDSSNPQRTFSWYRNTQSPDRVYTEVNLVDSGINKATLTLSDKELIPGWYYVDIDSRLNRRISNIKSTHPYRVVNKPVKPILDLEYAICKDFKERNAEELEEYFATEAIWKTLTEEKIESFAGQLIRLRINAKLTEDIAVEDMYKDGEVIDNLYTDGVTYEWYIITPDNSGKDSVGEKLDAESVAKYTDEFNNKFIKWGAALDKNYLDVVDTIDADTPAASFYCVVTNALGGKTAQFAHGDYEHIYAIY